MLGTDARAGVPDFDAHVIATMAQAKDNATTARVAQGIGAEVLQDPAHQVGIRMHDRAAGDDPEFQSASLREQDELLLQRRDQFLECNVDFFRTVLAGIQSR